MISWLLLVLRALSGMARFRASLAAENSVFRYKTIIGRGMRSPTLEGQRVEAQLGCGILNTMTNLGMPDIYRVA